MKNILLIFLLSSIVGCTSLKPFPEQARAGDTIMLAVGSADGMNQQNTSILFQPDDEIEPAVDLTSSIRSMTRIYPDKTSQVALFDRNLTGNVTYYSNHGPWQSVIVVDLPQAMPVGPGKIYISTSAEYPKSGGHINDKTINLDIVQGTGAQATFDYFFDKIELSGDFTRIEPLPQLVLRQTDMTQWQNYGAISVTVKVLTDDGTGVAVSDEDLRVVVDDQGIWNLESQRMSNWYRNGDLITVNHISSLGKLKHHEARFSVVLKPGRTFLDLPGPEIVSVQYFDENGQIVSGPTPELVFQ